jgi:hypothetical protein
MTTPNLQWVSSALILIVTLGLAVYDVWPAVTEVSGDTLSEVMHRWSEDWPILAYLWGVLGGHFFLGARQPVVGDGQDPLVLLWFTWVLFITNLSVHASDIELPRQVHGIVLLVGIGAGHLLWSLRYTP